MSSKMHFPSHVFMSVSEVSEKQHRSSVLKCWKAFFESLLRFNVSISELWDIDDSVSCNSMWLCIKTSMVFINTHLYVYHAFLLQLSKMLLSSWIMHILHFCRLENMKKTTVFQQFTKWQSSTSSFSTVVANLTNFLNVMHWHSSIWKCAVSVWNTRWHTG